MDWHTSSSGDKPCAARVECFEGRYCCKNNSHLPARQRAVKMARIVLVMSLLILLINYKVGVSFY